MSIEIQSLVDGVWLTRNRVSGFETREDSIGAAHVLVQRWHYNFDDIVFGTRARLRVFDVAARREVDASDEACPASRAVKLV